MTTGLVIPNALYAQQENSPVERVKNFYLDGRLDQSELEALRLLSQSTSMIAPEKAELYKILAFISIARNDPQSGRDHFINALTEMPNLRLDRGLTSPKILSVFDEARSDFRLIENEKEQTNETDIRPFKLRLEAGKKSLMLPGLGQLHKGHKTKGYVLLGAAGITAGGFLFNHFAANSSLDDYNGSTTSQEAVENWDKYESAWQMREFFGYGFVAVWIGATLDAFITEPILGEEAALNMGVDVDGQTGQPIFRLSIRF